MLDLISKNDCSGCTACASVCPKGAIEMKSDEEGFLYPHIIAEKCIDCSLCNKVCAFGEKKEKVGLHKKTEMAYVVKHNDNEVLFNSTSGGVFTAVSDEVLCQGGVVYGAVFDEDFNLRHFRAENESGRNQMRGSKYIQSDLRGIFESVKKDLTGGRFVLFVGTACQVDGLKSFLGEKYDNILFCDLICFGVSSPQIWKEYCENLQKKYGKLKEYKFRPKNWGYSSSKVYAEFEGERIRSSFDIALYKELYYSRLIMRPSCHVCPYANLARVSDITIGDCRQAEELFPDFGNKGASLVLINTEKGAAMFERISKKLTRNAVAINKVLQAPLRGPSGESLKRECFWSNYKSYGYKGTIRKFYGPKYRMKVFLSKVLYVFKSTKK